MRGMRTLRGGEVDGSGEREREREREREMKLREGRRR